MPLPRVKLPLPMRLAIVKKLTCKDASVLLSRQQEAPLKPEYQARFEQSMKDQDVGGHGLDRAYTCLPQGMPRMMSGVSLMEFGSPEAMWHLSVADFPAIVTMDAHGHSLHKDIEQESGAALERIGGGGRQGPGAVLPPTPAPAGEGRGIAALEVVHGPALQGAEAVSKDIEVLRGERDVSAVCEVCSESLVVLEALFADNVLRSALQAMLTDHYGALFVRL